MRDSLLPVAVLMAMAVAVEAGIRWILDSHTSASTVASVDDRAT